MVDWSDITKFFPSKESSVNVAKTSFHWMAYLIIGVLIATVIIVVIYYILLLAKYKNKIVIWEKIGENWEITGRDKAMEMKYGYSGDTVFMTLRKKKYLPRPTIQTGRRTYWYAIREDGEWINIGLEDIDMVMKRAKAKFLHPEMRYARTSLQKGFKERYDKQKFMEKYGHIIIPFAAFTLIAIFMWLFADKILTASDKLNVMIETSKEVMQKSLEVVAALDKVCR